jgi:ketosteroid isomerase-like protein
LKRTDVERWLARYEQAWRTAGTASLGELFTDDATYQQSPYAELLTGLGPIAAMWEAEREGPDEVFTMASTVVALDGNVAVVRVDVAYEKSFPPEYRDLWVIRFADDGRCAAFEEWAFWPGQPGIGAVDEE